MENTGGHSIEWVLRLLCSFIAFNRSTNFHTSFVVSSLSWCAIAQASFARSAIPSSLRTSFRFLSSSLVVELNQKGYLKSKAFKKVRDEECPECEQSASFISYLTLSLNPLTDRITTWPRDLRDNAKALWIISMYEKYFGRYLFWTQSGQIPIPFRRPYAKDWRINLHREKRYCVIPAKDSATGKSNSGGKVVTIRSAFYPKL